tara:strand:- start:324 stop:611 length:288 start_codon:yes stop_codon:yes gene_type:complete
MRSIVIVSLAALVVGVIAGLGTWVFRKLIALFQNVLFLEQFSFDYDPAAFIAPSPWGQASSSWPRLWPGWSTPSRRRPRDMARPRSWTPSTIGTV